MDAYPSLSSMQDMERDDYKAAGYNKLHELRLLKAAARLLLQPEAQESSSSNASVVGNAASPLMRSFSNIEHVLPSQLQRPLSRTPSGTPALPSLPPPPRLGRSNSAGSHRLAGYLLQPPPQVLVQPSSARAAVPAVPTAQAFESVAQPVWPRPPRHSEPTAGGAGPDVRVELLLAEVETLLAERQQLTSRCCSLQRDNDQLAELVGRLTRTVQDQELQLQQMHQQQQQPQQAVDGSGLSSVPSLSLPPAIGQQGMLAAAGVLSLQQQQHQLQRQRRVDEWLGRRQETWQEWQERVPLEHMHSGSSSTLTVALDQQQ